MRALAPRLMSGELHYWRVDPRVWERLIARAGELGLPSVASYVQWEFHEHAPGRFDFTGETDERRNLVRYLELVAASGLGLIIRPGPYTFAEWRNYGVPDRVVGKHRLDPAFLEAAGAWIDAVARAIAPFLESNGGPIFALQPDNMFDIGQNRYDRALGLLGGHGPFQEHLAERYGDVAALNAAWSTRYAGFEEAVATMADDSGDPCTARRHEDFVRFRSWYTERAARWTVERYRRAGVDVPMFGNATADQDLRGMSRVVDVVALNHYPTRGYAAEGEHQELMGRVRLAEALAPLSYVAELEAGMWHGFHYTKGFPSAEHYWFMLTTILAGGARAWNWYMLHDRDNWYMAPFNERGEPRREIVEVVRTSVQLWRRIEPWRWRRLTGTGVTLWRRGIGAEGSSPGAAAPAVADMLYAGGLDHVLVDLTADQPPPALLLFGGGVLAAAEQERLARYVEAGGHLVFWNCFPEGVQAPDGAYAQGYMDTFHKDLEVAVGPSPVLVPVPPAFGFYRDVPGEPIHGTLRAPRRVISDNILGEYAALTELGVGERLTVGYRERRGRGTVTVLAVPPQGELACALHEDLGVPVAARPLTPATLAALFACDDRRYLVVLNVGHEDATAAIALDRGAVGAGPLAVEDLIGGPGRGGAALAVAADVVFAPVPARNGTVLELRGA